MNENSENNDKDIIEETVAQEKPEQLILPSESSGQETNGSAEEKAGEPAEQTKVPPRNTTPAKNSMLAFLHPALVLGIISVVVALLLAVLNSVTADTIRTREDKEKLEALETLFNIKFPEDTNAEDLRIDADLSAPVRELYKVEDSYAFRVTPKGFGGEIDMLVGINPDKTIKNIIILSMSETPGIGSKVDDDIFLGQFQDINRGTLSSADTISGATISSKAVLSGISAALESAENIGD